MKKKFLPALASVCLLCLRVFGSVLAAEDAGAAKSSMAVVASPLAFQIAPAYGLPLSGIGSLPLPDSASYFSPGGELAAGLQYQFSGSPIALRGGLEYDYLPIQASQAVSALSGRAGLELGLPIAGGVKFFLYGLGGGYYATFNDLSASAAGGYGAAGTGLTFPLGSSLDLSINGQYQFYAGLYHGLSAGLGLTIPLGNLGGSLDIKSVRFDPAFPVFYKHYDDHPIGKISLISKLKVPATDVKVQVFVREYMDAPKTIPLSGSIKPGAETELDLFALLNDKVLGITEGTKVAAEITVDYKVDGRGYEDKEVETLSLLGRNAMTWDDNRKAAAFVTAKEPQVLDFARSVTSYIHAKETRSIADTLQSAIALHEAIDLYGINYTPNPVTPYSEAAAKKDAIDFLQFPRETFNYKAGDCSDLSILYASLLQSVGIETAFITVPGHIFVAVNSGVTADKAAESLLSPGMYIEKNGQAWIPVEITLRRQGFLKAWQLGAKEWSENQASGAAGFYPVREAWTVYQPVGLPGSGEALKLPQSDTILASYQKEMQKCIDGSVGPKIAQLQALVNAGKNIPAMNSLGILYARYGQADKAEALFKSVLAAKPYLPTFVNLGNLYFQRENWNSALDCYSQANGLMPNNPRIVLALARTNRELKNYVVAKAGFEKLQGLDAKLAAEYAYLGQDESGSRASDIGSERSKVIWEAEE